MATSKMIAIKKTLKKAIDYILNPDKTENGQLVSSYGCSIGTADIEMELTAKQGSGTGSRTAYHLIQSFSPDDDITPEKALELGIEFAQKVTGGKYEFVIATHTDKEHIHNHIIFNAVDYVQHKKYHSNTKDKFRIRDINDEICKENNLSVLEKYDGWRKYKYQNKHKNETAGWADKLKAAIDSAIQTSTTFEDFLFAMEMEGYTIKKGKYIAFHAPGQKNKGRDAYTRAKTIGDDYTEDAIKERIANKEKETAPDAELHSSNEQSKSDKPENLPNKKKASSSKRINLLVDINKNIKAQQSKGYERALIRSNINTLVKTMNFLIEHKLTTPDDFQSYFENKNTEYSFYQRDIKKLESELIDLSEKIKFTQNYKKYAEIFYESKRAKNQAEYIREHENQIVLFQASEIYFKKKQINPKEMNLHELFEKYKALKDEKQVLFKKSNSLKREIDELNIISKNIENALDLHFDDNTKQQNSIDSNDKRDKEKSEEQDL